EPGRDVGATPATRLPRRGTPGVRCRSAEEPREERDGRVAQARLGRRPRFRCTLAPREPSCAGSRPSARRHALDRAVRGVLMSLESQAQASESADVAALLAGLNPVQGEAVRHVDGPLLVLAGAGSGKTRVIAHRIAYLVAQGVDSRRILAVTFTNKAAGEMAQRVAAILAGRSGGGRPPLVATFHSTCARLLRSEIHH